MKLDISKGGLIELPEGVFEIDSPTVLNDITKGLTLIGKGRQRTILKVTRDLHAPVLTLNGSVANGKLRTFHYWSIQNLTLDGGNFISDALDINIAILGLIQGVEIIRFKGHALKAAQLWDTNIIDTAFAQSGDANQDKSVILLDNHKLWKRPDGKDSSPFDSNCNNNNFSLCRLDNNNYVIVRIGTFATKNKFLGCKFHGHIEGPEVDHTFAPPYNHIEMNGAFDNFVNNCNLTNCGASGAVLINSHCNSFTGSHINNCLKYGIELVNSLDLDTSGVVWGRAGVSNTCRLGNIKNWNTKNV
jgi:hypothetical protein